MKCLVLAGGKGNSLWPLSREKYPKQFMNMKGNRSLFQETIARNIPFCEEFLIVTNQDYHFIVEGQMQVFQGVKYRCFLEDERKGTGPAISVVSMLCNPSEMLYVVTSDAMVEIENYKEAVMEGQRLAKDSAAVLFGIRVKNEDSCLGYILSSGNHVTTFKEKPHKEDTVRLIEKNGMWNSGNVLFVVRNFLKELQKIDPKFYLECENVSKKLVGGTRIVHIPWSEAVEIPSVSIDHIMWERSGAVSVVHADYDWDDIGNFDTILQWNKEVRQNTIVENCTGTEIINEAENKLVMVNDIDNALVVNTDDAILITSKSEAHRRKRLIKNHIQEYNEFFENGRIRYRSWGTYENLTKGNGYKVKKVTLLPGKSFRKHLHRFRSEHWSVVQGIASVTLEDTSKDYYPNSSIFVPPGKLHCVSNNTDKELVIIEVSIGEELKEEDTVSMDTGAVYHPSKYDLLVKLEPVFKDFLWGGDKLRKVYHKQCDYDVIAESWEMSAHPSGQSIIAEGRHKGLLFGEYLNMAGREAWGWKCQAFDKFPILIKLIDAKENLSVQVHPDDEYALRVEGQYGKSEMWHIIDCDENACLYCGLKEDVSREELESALKSGKVLSLLNKIIVKKGDTFFIEAGSIHAIGAGILLCEIQQNSDVTYRLYDYDREDSLGKRRELHIEQAIQVADFNWKEAGSSSGFMGAGETRNKAKLLGECKYFKCLRYEFSEKLNIENDESSFKAFTFLEGVGKIGYGEWELAFKGGDSFFLCAGKGTISISGTGAVIVTQV